MKRIFSILISVALSISLFACVSAPKEKTDENVNNTVNDGTVIGSNELDISDTSEVSGEENGSGSVIGGNGNDDTDKAVFVRARVSGINIRSGKGVNFPSVGTIDKGDMVAYLGEEDGWYKTYYRSKVAYISAKSSYTELYKMNAADEETENIISVGLKLLGTPYVYGAVRYHDGAGRKLADFSLNEFDCSSLMQYMAYMGANKLLNLTTRTQIKQGVKVDKNDLKRGDLMFFTNASRKNNKGLERVGHVAMYLGDNYILHTASDYAVIEEISATRWSYFIQANRI